MEAQALPDDGGAEAQRQEGRQHSSLRECDRDLACCQEAARQDHAAAQSELGPCYFEGQGTEQDVEKAARWPLRALRARARSARCMEAASASRETTVKLVHATTETQRRGTSRRGAS